MYPSKVFRGHSAVVEDVAWHRHHRDLFASCGDDKVRKGKGEKDVKSWIIL